MSKINPTYYSKLNATTGFIVFIIKDALEFAGLILTDKKIIPSQLYKYYNYAYKKLKDRSADFNKKYVSL